MTAAAAAAVPAGAAAAGITLAAVFAEHDRDADGRLTLGEVEELLQAWQARKLSYAGVDLSPADGSGLSWAAVTTTTSQTSTLLQSPLSSASSSTSTSSLPQSPPPLQGAPSTATASSPPAATPSFSPRQPAAPPQPPLTWELQLRKAARDAAVSGGVLRALFSYSRGKLAGRHPSRPRASDLVWSCLGAFLAILAMGVAASCIHQWPLIGRYHGQGGMTLLIGSFGTLCVLLFARPEAEAIRPWNFVCGHVMSTAVVLALLSCFGPGVYTRAAAMAAAIGLMMWTDCVHPPGGALILLAADSAVIQGMGAWFMLYPSILFTVLVFFPLSAMCNWLKRHVAFDWPQPASKDQQVAPRLKVA